MGGYNVKKLFATVAAGFLLLGVMPQASAQYGDEPPARYALQIGIYRPSGERLKSSLGSNWKLLGLQYGLSFDEFERPIAYATLTISSDESANFEADLVSVEYDRVWWTKKTEDDSAYFGGGVGLYLLEQKDRPIVFMNWTERSGTKLGFTGVFGYQLKQGYFAEVRYTRVGELAEGVDFSGLSLNIGARLSI